MKSRVVFGILSILGFYFMNGCNQRASLQKGVSGESQDLMDNVTVYLYSYANSKKIDSCIIDGGHFYFNYQPEDYERLMIQVPQEEVGLTFWMQKDENIELKLSEPFDALDVSGSKLDNVYRTWLKDVEIWDNRADSIREIAKKSQGDADQLEKYRNMHQEFKEREHHEAIKLVTQNYSSVFSVYLLGYLKNSMEKKEVRDIYSIFSEEVKESRHGRSLLNWLDNSRDFKIGDLASNFELKNLDGDGISLSSYRGNYVLLEFYFKGCPGCKIENPFLRKAYRLYKEKGFDILGVTIDNNRTAWESGVKSDSLIWTTVSDYEGGMNVTTIYDVTYFPKNYLIDPNGIIEEIDLQGDNLINKLEDIYDGAR